MNSENNESTRNEDQFFQFDQRNNEPYSPAPADGHPITDNAEPDYGNDLVNEGLGNEQFDNENIGNEQFDNNQELDSETDQDEFDSDTYTDEEFGNEGLDNDEIDNLDEDAENANGADDYDFNPNR